MSLINKMLLDLEARQPSLAPAAVPIPIYQDLHAANYAPPPPRARKSLVLALLGIAVAAVSSSLWPPPAALPSPASSAPAQPPAQLEFLPVISPPPEITELPTTENHAAAPLPADAADVLQLHAIAPDATPPPVHNATRPVSDVLLTTPTEILNVEPVTILKTQRIVSASEHAQEAFREGQRRSAERNYPEAERSWRAVLNFDAHHVPAREQLVTLLLASGRMADAEELLVQGIARVPEQAVFALMLARIQVERGQETAALTMLEQAAAHLPGDVDIPAFIAALHQRAGRHAEAAQHYRQVLAVRPREARWWVGLAISLEAQQDWQAARAAYSRALNGTPLTPELMRYTEQRVAALRQHP